MFLKLPGVSGWSVSVLNVAAGFSFVCLTKFVSGSWLINTAFFVLVQNVCSELSQHSGAELEWLYAYHRSVSISFFCIVLVFFSQMLVTYGVATVV